MTEVLMWTKPDPDNYNPSVVEQRRDDPLLACEIIEMILWRAGYAQDYRGAEARVVIEDVAGIFFMKPGNLADFYYNFHCG